MQRLFKIGLGVAVGLVAIAGGLIGFAELGSERKLHRLVKVEVTPITLATDQAAIARGAYLYKSRGCADCHGADGGGEVVIDDGGLYVRSPKIVPDRASSTANYKPEDWVRTIRHGVKPNGEPVFIMPSEDFNRLTDADVGAIVVYVQSLSAVAGTSAEIRVALLLRLHYAAGAIKDSAEKIDHGLPPAQPFASNDEVAHGAYVAAGCKGCHNEFFSIMAMNPRSQWCPRMSAALRKAGVLASVCLNEPQPIPTPSIAVPLPWEPTSSTPRAKFATGFGLSRIASTMPGRSLVAGAPPS